MPEATQYMLTHKELVEAIIKATGVHEGRWVLNINIGFTIGTFGDGNQALPGALVAVNGAGIQKAKEDSPESLVVDAALVNPKSKGKAKA